VNNSTDPSDHGGHLLMDLFTAFSSARIPHLKVEYGVALTSWLLDNSPSDLDEVADLLKSMLLRSA
jgi:hypothetical protein